MSALDELLYGIELETDGVIDRRTSVRYPARNAVHTGSGNNVVYVDLGGSMADWIDPKTIQITGNLLIPTPTVALVETDLGERTTTMARVPSAADLFSSIRIRSRGTIVEEIYESDALSQILMTSSSNEDWLDTSGTVSNMQSDFLYRRVTLDSKLNLDLHVHKISGFFQNAGVYLHLGSFDNLQIELILRSDVEVFTLRPGSSDPTKVITYSLEDVIVKAELVSPSEAYRKEYDKLFRQGYSIEFPTYAHISNNVTGAGNQQVQIPFQAGAVRSIYTVVRPQADLSNKLANRTAFTSANFVSYQYQIGGKYYPSIPVTGYVEAYEALQRTAQVHRHGKHANITLEQFSEDFTMEVNETGALLDPRATGTRKFGKFVMAIDTELASSSPGSGIPMSSRGDSLLFNFSSLSGNHQVDTWIEYYATVSVSASGVEVTRERLDG